ncbi:MAG TPA: lytic murein transglycosylase, partial [Burkholderiales bacterium]|nr:lytic murein transglycosylase [Burkholderiales bacterium]
MKTTARTALRACVFCVACFGTAPAALAQEFSSCVRDLRREATTQGITAQTFDRAMTDIEPDRTVLEAMDNQPEFKLAIWDYLAVLVDEKRIADGRARLAEWETVLAAAEETFGVDRHVIVAVWGVESDYGRITGGRPLVRSLATVSCFGGRQKFFRGELIATLRILQSGDVPAEKLVGSWAGAFGQTQFMPSTFQRTAVD